MQNEINSIFSDQPRPPRGGRWRAFFTYAILFGVTACLLWMNRGFADYAITGLFWSETAGTVVHAEPPSQPVIQFTTPDGASHQFTEDYASLCSGRHSLCMIRYFTPGERETVVYKPSRPDRAFVHDWALHSMAMRVFLEAGFGFLLLLMLVGPFLKKPIRAEIGRGSNAPH
jgi:hypothetical protein